jgi:hypothetical protein
MPRIRWFAALTIFAFGCGGTAIDNDVDADVHRDAAVAETSSDRSTPTQDGPSPVVDGAAGDSDGAGVFDASSDPNRDLPTTQADAPSDPSALDSAHDTPIPPDMSDPRDGRDGWGGAGDVETDNGDGPAVFDTPFLDTSADNVEPPADAAADAAYQDASPSDATTDGGAGPGDSGMDAGPGDSGTDAGPGDTGTDAGPADGGCAATCNLVTIAVTPNSPTVSPYGTQKFQATGACFDGTVCDLTTEVAWTTSNAAVAVVSNASGTQGLVTAMNSGAVTVTASLGGISGDTQMTITSGEPVALYVTPVARSFTKGFHQPFVATLVFNDSTVQDVTGQVIWTSSAPIVASIGSDGVALGLMLGTTTIKADIGWLSGTTSVNVLSGTLINVTVEPVSPQLPAGVASRLRAIGHFTDASTQDLTEEASWISSDVTHATVSDVAGAKGRISAIAPGAATMTATVGAIVGTGTVNVSTATLLSIAPSIATTELVLNMTLPLHLLGTYSDGTTFDLADLATWSSSSNLIANVGGPRVTAAGVGDATIGAAFGGFSASLPVRVRAALLDRIEITPVNPTVSALASMAMHATVFYADGTLLDITDLAAYTINDPSVAAIGNVPGVRGILTGLAPGTSFLVAWYKGGAGSTMATVSP